MKLKRGVSNLFFITVHASEHPMGPWKFTIISRWATMRVERSGTRQATKQPMISQCWCPGSWACRLKHAAAFDVSAAASKNRCLDGKVENLHAEFCSGILGILYCAYSWLWGWWLAILGDFRSRSPFLIGDYLDIRHPPTFKNFHQSRIQGSHGLRFAALWLYACLGRGFERLRCLDYEAEDWTCFCCLSYFQWSFWFLWKVVGPLLHQVYCLGGNMIPTTFSGARKKTDKTESILLGNKKIGCV